MNTYKIHAIANYINGLKSWKGFSIKAGWKLEAEELPTSMTYDSSKLNNEILQAVNKAAHEVIRKQIPIVENELFEIVDEERKASNI